MLYLLIHSPKFAIKFSIIFLLKQLLKVFHAFPIDKNKILFISYAGTQYSCNPYYIYKRLKTKHPGKLKVYWASTTLSHDRICPEDSILNIKGVKFLFHILTSKVIIDNDGIKPYIPIRKNQLMINTWHGGGLFKRNFGRATLSEQYYLRSLHRLTKNNIKLFLSSCKVWTETVARGTFGYKGEVLNSGFPRNDIFFNRNDKIIKKVKDYFSIPQDGKIILYAPTFRGGTTGKRKSVSDIEMIDINKIINVLEEKTSCKYFFIFRGHHASYDSVINNVIDASHYPDMQELLVAADVFISDYSSCLWDFSLSFKPCFIYAPDFDSYVISPGFESDYKGWPFPIAKNNETLVKEIANFNQDMYLKKTKRYHEEYGSYENGTAADCVLDYIFKRIYN